MKTTNTKTKTAANTNTSLVAQAKAAQVNQREARTALNALEALDEAGIAPPQQRRALRVLAAVGRPAPASPVSCIQLRTGLDAVDAALVLAAGHYMAVAQQLLQMGWEIVERDLSPIERGSDMVEGTALLRSPGGDWFEAPVDGGGRPVWDALYRVQGGSR